MTLFSTLDLVPVSEGHSVADAMAATAALAKVAEATGCHRFWVAEHHGMEGVSGGAVSVVLAHIGHATSTIRIGAGGIMLPNHNPFVIAEQFGTLDALFPGRIDLGVGRAAGADMRLAQALRKDIVHAAEFFPQDVAELRAIFACDPAVPVRPTPGWGAKVDIWVLGSSLFGAQLAAHFGLPYAFASHFAPDHLDAALRLYRDRFQPSPDLERPHVMVAMNVFTAETERDAHTLASSQQQMFVAVRTGRTMKVQPPTPDYVAGLPSSDAAVVEHLAQASAIGSLQTVREKVNRFIERTHADELILCGATFDPAARQHGLRLTMEALAG